MTATPSATRMVLLCRKDLLRPHTLWNRLIFRSNSSLYCRDLCDPFHLSQREIKAILWTAVEMKSLNPPPKLLANKSICYLTTRPHINRQVAFQRAAATLGATLSTVMDRNLELQPNMTDIGRLTGSMCDCVVLSGTSQRSVELVADGARVPVINCDSDTFIMADCLADLLTMMETFGPLRRRSVAWIGPPSAGSFTWLYLAPKLGINLKMFRIMPKDIVPYDDGNEEQLNVWARGIGEFRRNAEFHECSSVEEAVYRADVIAVAPHFERNHIITHKLLEEAALDWYLFHSLPRTDVEVKDEVFSHKNNLTWRSASNQAYIAMAMLIQVLRKHENEIPCPDFEGPD